MTSICLIQRLRSQRLSRVSRVNSGLPNTAKRKISFSHNGDGKRNVCGSLHRGIITRRFEIGVSLISLTALAAVLLRQQAEHERNLDLEEWQNARRNQTSYLSTFPNTTRVYQVESHDGEDGEEHQAPTDCEGSPLQNVLATSSFVTSKEPSLENMSTGVPQLPFSVLKPEDVPSQEVDFIIVGYGNAGRSAAQTLLEKCPECSILVVDPNLDINSSDFKLGDAKKVIGSVVAMDHANQTIDLIGVKTSSSENGRMKWNDDSALTMKRIAYRESILLATGVRGAPPPESLIDNEAFHRILELKSTQPQLLSRFLNTTTYARDYSSFAPSIRSNPALSPEGVRQLSLMAASQGAKIGILGSGLEAIELAVACAMINKMKQTKQQRKGEESQKVCLSFGSAAPLGTILPRYLSTAVSKRLRSFGVDIEERSLVRYVEHRSKSKIQGSMEENTQNEGLEIHLVKSYDSLDTKRYNCDLLIVAPAVDGEKGSASLPFITVDDIKESSISSHQSWAKFLPKKQRGVVSCYGSDSRVMVNSELCAASGVYAAGSVAKYPNNETGHTAVAGEGAIDGGQAGKIAAQNMIKAYSKRSGRHTTKRYNSNFVAQNESFSIWRTDTLSGNGDTSQSSLPMLGIFSLCVGECDSETMSTHGFWWTNQASPNRHLSRRLSNVTTSNHGENKKYKPIYGSGVVYYLDRSGVIKGVMLWGLPFADSANELNSDLISRIKAVIRTDGKVVQDEHKNVTKTIGLTSSHLLEESKFLATLAVSKAPSPFIISEGKIQNSRPLHRYVPAKPISVTRTGNLKRHELTGHGVAGEDIFDRSLHDSLLSRNRNPSLIHYFRNELEPNDPFLNDGSSSAYMNNVNRDDDDSARPSKEDTIWMRRNEGNKTTSLSEKMNEIFMHHIMKGHFQDGSDAVKQAPKRKG